MGLGRAGRVIGRYALFDALAKGGMATVHFGRLLGPEGFARTVAIKRLHPPYATDPEFVSMFLDEARMCARIRHPNVVPTLDVVAKGGEVFLVMEYVHGESLGQLAKTVWARGEKIPWRVALSILSGTLHGLHAAHEAKDERGKHMSLVHRDVSPQNILVGVDGMARVADFGIAKATCRMHVTRGTAVKGKVGYMAPEQLAAENITRQADVYGAAVVLWESLAGRRLFEGSKDAIILARMIAGDVMPPSTLNNLISPELDAIVMRGLHRNPEERYRTAKEFANALDRVGGAGPSEVGEWVERTAAHSLERRASHVGIAELDVSEQTVTAPTAPSLSTSDSGRSRDESASQSGGSVQYVRPPMKSVHDVASKSNAPNDKWRPHPFALAVVGAAALTTISMWALSRGRAPQVDDAAAASPQPVKEATSATSDAVTPLVTSASSPATGSASAPGPLDAKSAWSTGGALPPRRPLPVVPTVSASASSKSRIDLGSRQ
ncbi:MAG: serine/threonine protein kinase [Polyangiaceae bacterium]|nr:serine/threonine protein kinase [Polyangiaceae bacterium]